MTSIPKIDPYGRHATQSIPAIVALILILLVGVSRSAGSGVNERPQLVSGACCFADGHCALFTQAECELLCGTYQGDNTGCTPNPCPRGNLVVGRTPRAPLQSNPFARKSGTASLRAGRNFGGAMLLHVDNSICYSTEADYCATDPLPATCEDLVTSITRDPAVESIIWMVAAFPSNSTPGVSAFQVGVTGDIPGDGYTAFGSCALLEIPDATWPAPGTGTACAFASPVYGRLFKMYWFAVSAPGTGSTLSTANYPHGDQRAEWADDGTPPVIDYCDKFGTVVWGGQGGNQCPGPIQSGACCLPDGSCYVVMQNNCAGQYLGDNTVCDPNPCLQPTGACCFPDGHCTVLTQAQCQQEGGAWQGIWTSCNPNPCPQPTGACCFHDGHCSVITQTQCQQQGGTYQGDGSPCNPNPCPQPTGACCFHDGHCTVLTQAQCQQQGGSYQGVDTSCDPNPCTHTGACCFPDGHCTIFTDIQCQQEVGSYQGDGITCDPNPCPQPTGACCFADESCAVLTRAQCQQEGGNYQGDGAACDPSPCAHTGACCVGFSCTIQTRLQCQEQGGSYIGDNTTCNPSPCCNSGVRGQPPSGVQRGALAKSSKTTEPNWHWKASGRAIVPEAEPNDTCPGQPLSSGDTVDPACVCNPPGGTDYDWYQFSADAGSSITIATFDANDCSYGSGVLDTYIELYANDCCTLLTYDDDSGPGFYSLINAYTAPYTGVYNLRARGYSPSDQGCYTMTLATGGFATGACCLPGGVCDVTNQIDCGNSGGTYYGDDVPCDPNPCMQPPANDLCSGAIVLERCTTGSLSDNTASYTNNYDPGSGGCTDGYPEAGNDATYVVDLIAGDIIDMTYTQRDLDGAFYIVTDCSNISGSCVVGADATVTGQPETIHYVVPTTGTYYIILDSYTTGGGPWTLDYTIPCGVPQACCFADGHCEMQLPNSCREMGGTPQGNGTTCESTLCEVTPTRITTWGRIKGSFR